MEEEEITKERKLLEDFFEGLAKKSDKVAYTLKNTERALELGAAEKVLISERVEESKIDELKIKAKNIGAEVVMISVETEEGRQFASIGRVGVFLRFPIKK